MNVLFLTLAEFDSLSDRNIYTDLLREFVKNGHFIYAVSPIERCGSKDTHLVKEGEQIKILRLQTGEIQKTNIVRKGINTLLVESRFLNGIKNYYSHIKFDLILYSTPPITLVGAIEFVKNRDKAKTYLLLKDIFPQNAVDLGMMKTTGVKGILYQYFRRKEKRLYEISDRIGCMSQANVDYILKHNPEIDQCKVEVCPNSIDPVNLSLDKHEKIKIRRKYNLPLDRTIFVYGGNLGKAQGIPFLIQCIDSQVKNKNAYFLIVGNGTDFGRLQNHIDHKKPENVKLMKNLPVDEYVRMIASCDIGMIFLDHRFTIPNFPSRLLGYLQAKLPVLAVTDPNTDIGQMIVKGDIGWWCESNQLDDFNLLVDTIIKEKNSKQSESAYRYLLDHYQVKISYNIIMKSV